MSMTTIINDFDDDNLSCIICFELYDTELHAPKFLACHHSLCVLCLKNFKTKEIACPTCRQITRIEKEKEVEDLPTNFYIRPIVEKITATRKVIDTLLMRAQQNRAQAIKIRRDTLGSRLTTVAEAMRILENKLASDAEQNNEAIAILQSLMDEIVPSTADKKFNALPPIDKCQSQVKDSEGDLETARTDASDILDVEKLVCCITLTNPKDGTEYQVRPLQNKPLAPRYASKLDSHLAASVSLLSYVLVQLRHMWQKSLPPPEPKVEHVVEPGVTFKKTRSRTAAKENVTNGKEVMLTEVVQVVNNKAVVKTSLPLPSGQRYRVAFLQIILNGVLKPKLVIQLDLLNAPLMCAAFQKFCTGSDNLTYETTPIFQAKQGHYITGGRFNDLKQVDDDYNEFHERDQRFIADHSALEERRNAIRMRHRGRCDRGVWVCSEFSILLADQENTDQMTTVFGYLLSGIEVCEEVSKIDLTRNEVNIDACGMIS